MVFATQERKKENLCKEREEDRRKFLPSGFTTISWWASFILSDWVGVSTSKKERKNERERVRD